MITATAFWLAPVEQPAEQRATALREALADQRLQLAAWEHRPTRGLLLVETGGASPQLGAELARALKTSVTWARGTGGSADAVPEAGGFDAAGRATWHQQPTRKAPAGLAARARKLGKPPFTRGFDADWAGLARFYDEAKLPDDVVLAWANEDVLTPREGDFFEFHDLLADLAPRPAPPRAVGAAPATLGLTAAQRTAFYDATLPRALERRVARDASKLGLALKPAQLALLSWHLRGRPDPRPAWTPSGDAFDLVKLLTPKGPPGSLEALASQHRVAADALELEAKLGHVEQLALAAVSRVALRRCVLVGAPPTPLPARRQLESLVLQDLSPRDARRVLAVLDPRELTLAGLDDLAVLKSCRSLERLCLDPGAPAKLDAVPAVESLEVRTSVKELDRWLSRHGATLKHLTLHLPPPTVDSLGLERCPALETLTVPVSEKTQKAWRAFALEAAFEPLVIFRAPPL
ncbi:MAG: hypothetical protein ACOZQL_02920 [Myxococcota bacterium]